jgi:hypothetical protein
MAHTDRTPRQLAYVLLERWIGQPLDLYVAAQRDQGLSWRTIARQLSDRIGTDVSYETLRAWFAAADKERVKA